MKKTLIRSLLAVAASLATVKFLVPAAENRAATITQADKDALA